MSGGSGGVRARRRRRARRGRGRHAARPVPGRHPPRRRGRHLDRRGQRRAGRRRPDAEAVTDRLVRLWASPEASDVYGDSVRPAAAPASPPAPTCTRRGRCAGCWSGELGEHATFADLAVPFQCCAASIERAAEHWFDTRPAGRRGARLVAVPGLLPPVADRRRALPRRRHRQLDPDRRGGRGSAPTRIFVLQVGRIERPLTRAPPAVGGRAGRVRDRPPAPVRPRDGRAARRRRGARAAHRRRRAAATTTPAGVPRHGGGAARGSAAPTRAARGATSRRIPERPTDAAAALGPPAGARAGGRRCSPSSLLTTAAGLAAARAGRVAVRAGPAARRCGCSGWRSSTCSGTRRAGRAVRAVDRVAASAGGSGRPASSARTTCSSGWFLRVLFWEARRVAAPAASTWSAPTRTPRCPAGRVLVLCRHAGPGDSFILIHALVNWYDREPRIVLKDTLQWDPADRRAAQPAAQPLHPAGPGAGEDARGGRSASWPPASTTTTRS